jgi:DNA modification methylase
MIHRQLPLLRSFPETLAEHPAAIRDRLADLLGGDLDFRGAETGYASHRLHSFAAKFPPQLPRLFIQSLTRTGQTVLDPMAGSGTTVIEAILLGRKGVGVDLDPLAVQIGLAKTTWVRWADLVRSAREVIAKADRWLRAGRSVKLREFRATLDDATKEFLDYWFLPSTQEELAALIAAIREESDATVRRLLLVAFSSTIVTKLGGVSLARDLAHSRPHRDPEKRPPNALDLFWERVGRYRRVLLSEPRLSPDTDALVVHGDARTLPIADSSVHLIVTSPPYANAIDYMRAHKFSLVWMGKRIGELSLWRSRYIGAERATENEGPLPHLTQRTIGRIAELDSKRARVLGKYFTDMRQALREMHRVLCSGAAAIIVVGPSTMRGLKIETHQCLAEIAESVGFDVVRIRERQLDRDRRMMPVSARGSSPSTIEARMHREYIIGLVKPGGR